MIALPYSYLACRNTVRRSGSNFGPCFWVLPRKKREAMEALYAFMRHSDDLADEPSPLPAKREALARWRAALSDSLAGRDAELPDDRPGEAILPAVVDTVRRFAVPEEHLLAVLDGVAMDLDGTQYATFDELAVYCRRVASAVGLACIHVWGFSDRRALEPADRCGIAFQLTNILRDLKEDAAAGRIYLPREDLCRCGYSAEDLAAGVADERFLRLMEIQVDRARQFYREAAGLYEYLGRDGRRIFGLMMSVYGRLLGRIARRPAEVLRRRIHVPAWQKLGLAARWMLVPPGRIGGRFGL